MLYCNKTQPLAHQQCDLQHKLNQNNHYHLQNQKKNTVNRHNELTCFTHFLSLFHPFPFLISYKTKHSTINHHIFHN